jgi:hypothetical protein
MITTPRRFPKAAKWSWDFPPCFPRLVANETRGRGCCSTPAAGCRKAYIEASVHGRARRLLSDFNGDFEPRLGGSRGGCQDGYLGRLRRHPSPIADGAVSVAVAGHVSLRRHNTYTAPAARGGHCAVLGLRLLHAAARYGVGSANAPAGFSGRLRGILARRGHFDYHIDLT